MDGPAAASSVPAKRPGWTELRRVLGLAAALVAILGYDAVGRKYYQGYAIPQGYGMDLLLPAELAQTAMFLAFGGLAMLGLAAALAGSGVIEGAVGAVRKAARRLGGLAGLTAVWIFVASFSVSRFVMGHAVITDDEHVYRFIAQTLRTGSLTAPSPREDLAFFQEQFVVLDEHVRYGKYPIGHPLLLAAGQAFGAEGLVIPGVTALLALAVWRLGRTLFAPEATAVALLLLASSPQVILTGATLLSQPTAALCLAAGLAALFAPGRGPLWLAVSGIFFGYGVLVRPLPGVLFVGVALLYILLDRPREDEIGALARRLAAFLAPVALFAAVFLAVNRLQAGDPFTTGYQTFHHTGEGAAGIAGAMGGDLATRSMSVMGSLIRLDVWLLGWPVSLLFCLFPARDLRVRALWGMAGAEIVYRVLSPKVGVGGVGPLYLFEVAPLLVLLAGAGAVWLVREARYRWRPATLAAVCVAGVVVCAAMFLPPRLAELRRMAAAQLALPRMLQERGVAHALVFHDGIVPPGTGLSWAYYPPCNPPGLDGDVLYLRLWKQPAAGHELWRRRFPERSAWWFGYRDGRPALVDFESFVRNPPPSPAPVMDRP